MVKKNMKARMKKYIEVTPPKDLVSALKNHPRANKLWNEITPIARRDWILWIITAKQKETRARRIEVACSKLSSGMKRVCCFGGINWLLKTSNNIDKTTLKIALGMNQNRKTAAK